MNEQPFADPKNPPKPDLRSRESLTKRITELLQESAKCIAENNPKGAVVVQQQLIVVLHMLLIDELQSTQQMFERIDKKIDGSQVALASKTFYTPVFHPRGDGEVPAVSVSDKEHDAYETVVDSLAAIIENDKEGLLRAGAELLFTAVQEWRSNFMRPRGQ